jgi:hypothetical protein
MSLERTRGRYGSRGWRSRSPELRREHSMVMEHSPFIASFACRLHDASCYHVFSLRAFVCTVCVNIQRNSRANKRTIANLETQNFLDVSFKSHRAQTIKSEIYHQMIVVFVKIVLKKQELNLLLFQIYMLDI